MNKDVSVRANDRVICETEGKHTTVKSLCKPNKTCLSGLHRLFKL